MPVPPQTEPAPDFGDIVAYPPASFKGIVALQVLDHPEATGALIERLVAYLMVHPAEDDYRGKLIGVEPYRVRIRG
jgi:hypothetical protein